MAFKFIVLATVLAAANAGLLPAAPVSYAANPVSFSYAAPAVAHAAPLAYAAPAVAHAAPLAYAAPAVAHAAPLAYAAPAVAHAAPVAYAAPVAKAVVTKQVDVDYDPNPQYSYAYDVQDGLTGDNKQHQESRNGDVVEGSYSFIESDGTRRTVHYTADPVNGFNAVVDKQPAAVAVKTIAKVAAPAVVAHAAPVAYAAPAPIAYHAAPALKLAHDYAAPLLH